MLNQLTTSVKVTLTLKLLAIMVLAGIEPTFFVILPVFVFATVMTWMYVRKTGTILTWYMMQVFQTILFAIIVFYGFNAIAALLGTVAFFILFVIPFNILGCSSIWQQQVKDYTDGTMLPDKWKPQKDSETKIYEAEVVDD